MSSPAYYAFTVSKRNGIADWVQIGAAFRHHCGDGYSIVLQALPLPTPDDGCTIVLRKPTPQRRREERSPKKQKKKLLALD